MVLAPNLLIFTTMFLMIASTLWILKYQDRPIYSVVLLIAVFLLTAIFLFALNIKFLAFTVLIVYVGAVALLFVFVVFMLGPIQGGSKSPTQFFLFFYSLYTALFFLMNASNTILQIECGTFSDRGFNFMSVEKQLYYHNDIYLFSQLLYTKHFFVFFMVSLILLVSMIGSILLCFNFSKIKSKV